MQHWFFDKMSMYQDHSMTLPKISVETDLAKPLPLFGKFGRSLVDLDSGDIVSHTVTSKKVEGSYKTSLQIRCDGSRVSVTGNPSKFGRLDNVFGYQKIDDCVAVFNAVLKYLGLPPFTKASYYYPTQTKADRASFVTDGAIITHVDLTQNHACGDSMYTVPALRALSTNTGGRKKPHLHANFRTVDWIYEKNSSNGSTYLYSKAYDKAFEMNLHKPNYEMTEEERNYLNQLVEYVYQQGCIREEHSLKSKFLKRHKANIYGIVDEQRLDALFEKVRDMFKKSGATVTDYQNVRAQLMANDACTEAMATKMQNIVYAWTNGENIRAQYSNKQSFYRHRNLLLPLGIDISLQFDVTRMPTKIKLIELKPMAPPEFYRHPNPIHQLKQVA